MKKKVLIIGAAVIILGLITVQLLSNKSKIDSKKKVDTSVKSVTVTVDNVVRRESASNLDLVGTTIPTNEVLLQSEVAAQVTEIHFKIGDYVTKGKLLVQLDDKLRELALESAKLNLSKLEDEYNKTKNLYSGKASSETQLRDSRINYETAKVAVNQAKKQLDQARITAPQSGYIVQKFVEKGSYLNVGSQVLSIVDLSKLKVALNVAESDVYKLKLGQNVNITASVYQGVTYSGRVSFISAKGDKTHNYSVEVEINNQPSHQLKAGTFVTVDFAFQSSGSSLQFLRQALVGSIKDAKVYVVRNNVAHLESITIGKDFGKYFEAVSGLNEGDQIVIDGQINLVDGSAVTTIKKTNE
jgi:membrane fusion protein, multidrug efflux system